MTPQTYLKAANEVSSGDVVVEADGFMWQVHTTWFHDGRVQLLLSPSYPSMTARGDRTVTLRKSASVRVAVRA